jgi:hypothetical protein
MSSEATTIPEILEEFNQTIGRVFNLNVFSRALALQQEEIDSLDRYIARVKQYKYWAIEKAEEPLANLFFHCQCLLQSLQASLHVWVVLKTERPSDAWSHLIDAQEYLAVASKAKPDANCAQFEQRLCSMEESLFPSQSLYNSAGFSETIGKCSICQQPFLKCDHLEGHIYMGQLCQRVDRQILEVNHGALVRNPRDRRCILVKHSNDDGQMIDRFTLEDVGPKKEDSDQAMHVEGVIMSFRQLDLA